MKPFESTNILAAYVRDSGGDNQDLSTTQQEAAIKKWAADNGYIITIWFRDDARPGSSVVGRTGFQEMMAYFRRGGCQEAGIVIWKMSRFARDIDDAQFYKSDLRRRGYKIYSLSDNIPEGPEGRFFEAAIDWMNQRFLEDLSTDVKRGLRDLVENYGAVPGTPPRGFKKEPVQLPPRKDGSPHTGHRWVPDPDVIPLVQAAFQMRAAGESLQTINQDTHLFGCLNSYKTFFKNQLYRGILIYGDLTIENYCEPIIDLTTWEIVQKKLEATVMYKNLDGETIDHPRRQNSRFLLSGLLYCARCGSPLFGQSMVKKGRAPYDQYNCSRAKRRRDCDAPLMPRKTVEEAVLKDIREYILQADVLQRHQAYVLQAQDETNQQLGDQQKAIKKEMANLRRRINNLADAIAENGYSSGLADKLRELEAKERDFQSHLAELERQAEKPLPMLDEAQIAALSANLCAILQGDDKEKIRDLLRGFVKKITIDRDGSTIRGMIEYFYPPVEFDSAEDTMSSRVSHRRDSNP